MRIALIQINSDERRERNLDRAEELIRDAASKSPDIVALPECFNFLASEKETLPFAEPVPGPTTSRLAGICREYGFYILCGSIAEKTSDPRKYRNTSALIGPDGDILAKYSKIHLFDMDIPGEVCNMESSTVIHGTEPVLLDTSHGRIGLSICYDLRFPELYRTLALAGAVLIFVPSAFATHTGKDHWEVLLRARAIENQVFIAAPAQYGWHQGKRCYGNSMIVDPWGTVIARASDRESVVIADLDKEHLQDIRRQNQCLGNVRSNIGEIRWKGGEADNDNKCMR